MLYGSDWWRLSGLKKNTHMLQMWCLCNSKQRERMQVSFFYIDDHAQRLTGMQDHLPSSFNSSRDWIISELSDLIIFCFFPYTNFCPVFTRCTFTDLHFHNSFRLRHWKFPLLFWAMKSLSKQKMYIYMLSMLSFPYQTRILHMSHSLPCNLIIKTTLIHPINMYVWICLLGCNFQCFLLLLYSCITIENHPEAYKRFQWIGV